jgi:RNA polymerase sigma factor (sigma-70 family)
MRTVTALEKRVNERASEPVLRNSNDLVPLEEERAVILRLQQGDRSAAAVLYGWYGDAVYRQVVLPRLPNPDLANDCLAETFVTALTKIGSYRFQNVSIFFWLRRIAINKVVDVYRRQGRNAELPETVSEEESDLTEPAPKPDRNLEVEDTRKMVETSLSRLNPRYAEVLKLRLIEERPREECAEVLGIKVGTLDVLLHRATKAFRKVYPP